jgi:hypothetical protein
LEAVAEGIREPMILDFFDEEEVFENFSFCEQLMNEEWNCI